MQVAIYESRRRHRATQNPASCDLVLQSASMPPPPPPLMDELVEEILLRLPLDSPASLVRAGLVRKRWCHLVSDPTFRRRFIDFHGRAPPMLGFMIYSRRATRFVPTSTSGGLQLHANLCGLKACDSRHGRVLLRHTAREYRYSMRIVVWNPITGEQLKLPRPAAWDPLEWTAAVLCAGAATSGACDHLDCHRRPFIVVLVGTTRCNNFVCTYDSEDGAWSEPTFFALHYGGSIDRSVRSTLVGNTIYFVLHELGNYFNLWDNYRNFEEFGGDDYQNSYECSHRNILEYNLETRIISVVQLPGPCSSKIELTTTEDGRLGFVRAEQYSTLYLWSREVEEPAGWVLSKTVQLTHLLPTRDVPWQWASGRYLVGSAEGVGIIFLTSNDELFTLDLRSGRVTMVYAHRGSCLTIPYINFCTPVFRAPPSLEGPRTSTSSDT